MDNKLQKKTLIFIDDEREFNDVLWVDYQSQYDNIIIVRTFMDFVQTVENMVKENPLLSNVDFSFDHDLQEYYPKESFAVKDNGKQDFPIGIESYGYINKYGDRPNEYEFTGFSCLRYLIDFIRYEYDGDEIFAKTNVYIHTKNNIACERMKRLTEIYFNDYQYEKNKEIQKKFSI